MNTVQVIESELNSILHSNLSELFYQNIGSTWFMDTAFLFVLTPLIIISLLFNASCCFCVITNNKRLTNLPLYRFLLGYATNNCVVAFILVFLFCSTTPRYIPIFLSIYSRIYRCIILNYVLAALYFVGKAFEILILFERLSNFHPRLKRHLASFNYARMHTTMPIVYVLCAVLNVPIYFRRSIKSDDHLLKGFADFNRTRSISYCDQSPLASTAVGWSLVFLMVFVRDFLTLVVEVALSIWLVVSFRRFISSKMSAHNMPANMLARMHAKQLAPQDVNTRLRFVTFRKTTRTIMTFAIVSIAFNMTSSTLFLIATLVYSNTVGIDAGGLVICILISKQFLTFYVFYKLDKNIVEVFRICRCQTK